MRPHAPIRDQLSEERGVARNELRPLAGGRRPRQASPDERGHVGHLARTRTDARTRWLFEDDVRAQIQATTSRPLRELLPERTRARRACCPVPCRRTGWIRRASRCPRHSTVVSRSFAETTTSSSWLPVARRGKFSAVVGGGRRAGPARPLSQPDHQLTESDESRPRLHANSPT